jgi:hypothetical protein
MYKTLEAGQPSGCYGQSSDGLGLKGFPLAPDLRGPPAHTSSMFQQGGTIDPKSFSLATVDTD